MKTTTTTVAEQEREERHLGAIRESFLRLNREFLDRGASLVDLRRACEEEISSTVGGSDDEEDRSEAKNKRKRTSSCGGSIGIYRKLALAVLLPILCGIAIERSAVLLDYAVKQARGTRCLLPANYLVWEFTRPVSDCNFCRGLDSALVLDNLTREEFAPHAYSSRPIVVRKAASHWLAAKVFGLRFFRGLYDNVEGAYESVEEDCQFLQFRSDFSNLREVLSMSESRALNLPGEEPWYVGWKNCHPQIVEIMRQFYEPPHFLPEDAEMPNANYIFLGYDRGADMHLDYISRLMWQGQLIGSKTWTVAPTPECEDVCERFSFFVGTGDVVLLDTRIWYHGTQVENGRFSLTITSEYG